MGKFVDALDGLADMFGGSKIGQGRGAKPFDMLGGLDDLIADDEPADDEPANDEPADE
jgi:hypothetical protein